MAKDFALTPRDVPEVDTPNRCIHTQIPVPESIPLLEQLRRDEPRCMSGQPPIIWDKAEGFSVCDPYGNRWIDFSSGVLIANAGHGREAVVEAIVRQAQRPMLTSYCFPNAARARLVNKLAQLAPEGLDKVFLLSTGSETVECTIKISREHGRQVAGPDKRVVVSFERSFHGRTLGSQMVGGFPTLKDWIGNLDADMVQVPFPDGFRTPDTGFELFEQTLADKGVNPDDVCAVICETYQGSGASFAPVEYMQRLRKWCDRHTVVMVLDEVQAGFGRTGPFWGFEHYGVVPDLFCLGKGISSSLPISAVIGRSELMDLFPPGSMTSTHSGNPVCCAAALANVELILAEDLPGNSARVGSTLHQELARLTERFADRVGAIHGKGLVAGIHCVHPGTIEPDGELAWRTVCNCVDKGLMLFAPVGVGGATVKICPPLCITESAVKEGVGVIEESMTKAVGKG